jgi:hypothetical protein
VVVCASGNSGRRARRLRRNRRRADIGTRRHRVPIWRLRHRREIEAVRRRQCIPRRRRRWRAPVENTENAAAVRTPSPGAARLSEVAEESSRRDSRRRDKFEIRAERQGRWPPGQARSIPWIIHGRFLSSRWY